MIEDHEKRSADASLSLNEAVVQLKTELTAKTHECMQYQLDMQRLTHDLS